MDCVCVCWMDHTTPFSVAAVAIHHLHAPPPTRAGRQTSSARMMRWPLKGFILASEVTTQTEHLAPTQPNPSPPLRGPKGRVPCRGEGAPGGLHPQTEDQGSPPPPGRPANPTSPSPRAVRSLAGGTLQPVQMGPVDAAAPLLEGAKEEVAAPGRPRGPGIDMSAHVGLRGLLAAHVMVRARRGRPPGGCRAGGSGADANAGRAALPLLLLHDAPDQPGRVSGHERGE